VTYENTSETEPLVVLRYFGPDVNPDAPAMEAFGRTSFEVIVFENPEFRRK